MEGPLCLDGQMLRKWMPFVRLSPSRTIGPLTVLQAQAGLQAVAHPHGHSVATSGLRLGASSLLPCSAVTVLCAGTTAWRAVCAQQVEQLGEVVLTTDAVLSRHCAKWLMTRISSALGVG